MIRDIKNGVVEISFGLMEDGTPTLATSPWSGITYANKPIVGIEVQQILIDNSVKIGELIENFPHEKIGPIYRFGFVKVSSIDIVIDHLQKAKIDLIKKQKMREEVNDAR